MAIPTAIDFGPGTVYVSGSYGSGKSAAVCEHLSSAVRGDKSLLVICYRQSQGLDFAGKMIKSRIPFSFYLGMRAETIQKHKSRLLISTQSLSKICPLIQYDTVVIDETTSLLLDAAVSDLVPKENMAILMHVMAAARKLICMDVNLPTSTLEAIQTLRPCNPYYTTPAGLPLVQEIHKPYENKIVFEDSFDIWRCGIQEELLMGKNIVICSDSKKELIALCEDLPDTVKKRVYVCGHPYREELQDVNEVWSGFQVVAYSPSIVTATSFTNEHFNTVYGLFTYSSLSARAFAQQLHRVRNLGSKTIVVHAITPTAKYLRNQAKLVQEFDVASGTLADARTPLNVFRKLFNGEIERTYRDFNNELLDSIHAIDSNSPSSPW